MRAPALLVPRSLRAPLSALGLGLALVAGPGLGAEPAAPAPPAPAAPAHSRTHLGSELHVTGMTFLGRGGSLDQIEVRAREGYLHPDKDQAELFDVHASSTDRVQGHNFDVTCARGVLDIATNDFLAEGDVRGSTADGRSYQAPWVRYDHERGLLYTDAPVVMRDATGTFRGNGFRYDLKQRTFRLLGNVSVEHTP